ncbi:MAG: hypothetical protein AMXMBFR80_20400 [Dehalococcoidia bacterium]
MNRFTKLSGIGAIALAAGIAGGVGVAFGLGGDDGDGGHGGQAGMMPTDPATMSAHMRALLGDMTGVLGEDAYAAMLTRMADACAAEGMAMATWAPEPPNHGQHHPGAAAP